MSKKNKLLEQIKTNIESDVHEREDRPRSSRSVASGTGEHIRRVRNAKWIPLERIQPDPDQPRKRFTPESLDELAQSIRHYGILQPLNVDYVEQEGEGYYRIISGERRYHAARLAGLDEVPCLIRDGVTDETRYAQQLIENIQREDLSPVEKAVALLEYKKRMGEQSVWADVEKQVGLSTRRRQQYLALLNLPEPIQAEIVSASQQSDGNPITEKHARALLLLNQHPRRQQKLLNTIKTADKPITGDDALKMAREQKGGSQLHKLTISYRDEQDLMEKLEQKLNDLKRKYPPEG
jgi:ParB family chromosome partitioning protein